MQGRELYLTHWGGLDGKAVRDGGALCVQTADCLCRAGDAHTTWGSNSSPIKTNSKNTCCHPTPGLLDTGAEGRGRWLDAVTQGDSGWQPCP